MNLVEAIKHCKDDEKFAIYATAPFTKNSEARIGIAALENGEGESVQHVRLRDPEHKKRGKKKASVGGKEGNKHANKKLHAGRGAVGKVVVAGAKERETNQVKAEVVPHTDGVSLQRFVTENTEKGSTVYTDEASAYKGIPRKHFAVKHSVGHFGRRTGSHKRN